MTARPKTILVTRPQPQAAEFAALLEKAGFDPVLSPLLTIRPLADGADRVTQMLRQARTPEAPDLLLVTSRAIFHHAADMIMRLTAEWAHIPVITSGETTAASARACGFENVTASPGHGSAGMLDEIAQRNPKNDPLRILYLTGTPRTPLLETDLAKQAELQVISLYESSAANHFTPEAYQHMEADTLDAVTLFSAKTAEIFGQLSSGLPEPIVEGLRGKPVFCLSDAIARRIMPIGFHHCHIANAENQMSLIDKLVDQLKAR